MKVGTRPASLAAAALIFGLSPIGCRRNEPTESPEFVVRELLESLQKSHGDLRTAAQVESLLWEPARKNLAERARRATALSGRTVASAEILVPSWLTLDPTLAPASSRVDGDWAEVVLEADGVERSRARLHREEGHWKVVLELPELPPIRQRPTTAEPTKAKSRN